VVKGKKGKFKTIIYEKGENVAWITLNRPEALNASNDVLRSELLIALAEARDDDEVWIVVLTGAGDRAFSAGGDIGRYLSWTPLDVIKSFKGARAPTELVRAIPKPVIAMVNGLALGGGCELAMACDIIIASENARFGQPEINVGIIPGWGGTQILPRLIGEKKAKELLFTGDFISAEEALTLRMVNKVVPKEKLRETVEELIIKLKSKSPVTLKFAKLAVNRSLETPLSAGMASETELLALCFATEDQKEGTRAFLDKRAANYKAK